MVKSNKDIRDAVFQHPNSIIANDAYQLLNLYSGLASDISGVHESSEGQREQGVTSGRMTLSLQEATNRFMRHQGRIIEVVLQKVMKKVVWLIYKNYKKGRKYSYTVDAQQRYAELPMDFDEFEMILDVVVAPGSNLPRDKQSMANLALSLYGMNPQVWNDTFVNKMLDIENDVNTNLAQKYEQMKNEVMGIIQNSGGNPQLLMQAVQTGQLPEELLRSVLAELQQQQTQQPQMAGQPQQGQPPRQSAFANMPGQGAMGRG